MNPHHPIEKTSFGSLDKCRLPLSEIYDEDWSKDDKEVVKDEVKVIVRGYVRFFILKEDGQLS